jgi:hypothetical protein
MQMKHLTYPSILIVYGVIVIEVEVYKAGYELSQDSLIGYDILLLLRDSMSGSCSTYVC